MPKEKKLLAGIIGIMILLASGGTLSAAVSYTSLPPITANLKAPDDVAIGPDGKIYIVDGYQDKIFIYDRQGTSVGSLLIENPTSIAINTDGTIYIASNYDLSVKILNPSGEITGSLGKGKDEFRLPRNITIDKTTGNVFVVDQLDNSIKIYTPEGAYLKKISDPQNQPQDVTIRDDELYVIDYPRMIDYMGGIMRSARVQTFGMDGYPLSNYRYDDTANRNRSLAMGTPATTPPPLEGPQRFGINAGGAWTGNGREVIRVYTSLYGDYVYGENPPKNPLRSIAANAKTHITVYMSQTGASAGVYAELYEYNDATGIVGTVKGTTLVQPVSQANGDAQEFNLTFNNAVFEVATGNRLVVYYYFNAVNSEPVLLFGSLYGSATPAGPTYFTVGEYFPGSSYGSEKNYYIWIASATDVGIDGTTNITQFASRSFGRFGLNIDKGEFVNPVGITSDAEGILYITDTRHGVVMCFNGADGSYLGTIQDPLLPMSIPKGIALGEDGRLFVTAMASKRLNIFGLEGYVSIGVGPSSLTFQGTQGMPNPPQQSLVVSNAGTGTLTYTAASTSGWIVLNAPTGSVVSGGSATLPVGVDITGLTPSTYHGTIAVIDTVSGVSEDIAVTLEVKAVPVLSVSTGTLSYTYLLGGTVPASRTVTINISNDTNGTTTWTAVPDANWLSISPSSMTGNSVATANVSVQPSGLAPATYMGHISITAPGAIGSPADIVVTLEVKTSGGIHVSCNITGASFSITGPVDYEGNGTSWTAAGVPDGTYTITYDPVTGYKAPLPETKQLTGGGQISFDGTYINLAMSANIVVSRPGLIPKQAGIGIFSASGELMNSFALNLLSRFFNGIWKFSYLQGATTALGDIDGDGEVDIVAGFSADSRNTAVVSAYRSDGGLIQGSTFMALYSRYGVNLATADFDGDGKAEIIVGAGSSPENTAQVRIFSYNGSAIRDKGINLLAFAGGGGVNVAAGDVDGDGIPELITAAGASPDAAAEIRVWKIDTSESSWSLQDTGVDFVAFDGSFGAYVTTGDINGDGTSEIITGSGPDPCEAPDEIKISSSVWNTWASFAERYGRHIITDGSSTSEMISGTGSSPHCAANRIKVFNGDGTEYGLEIADGTVGYGLRVASADLDSDGVAEIVVGLGPSPKNPSTVTIYKSDGIKVGSFTAFEGTGYGAVISVGDLGY